nr:ATP-grasp domain-containing protein [Desulfogranum mediterraneum]
MKNIFVVGLDDFHLAQLEAVEGADNYRFHSLISYREIKCGSDFPVRELLEHTAQTLTAFDGTVDAVIGYWDFPVSTVLPIIRRQVGLGGPSLVAVLKCEHKYWSRLIQEEVVPELIPPFQKINPFAAEAPTQCSLDYPFWIKPVKSVLSHLGFLVRNREEFEQSLEKIRSHIGRYAEPFNLILNHAELPAEIERVDGYYCIAEGLISRGRQCTLEGYVCKGRVQVYGVIDSLREGRHCSSFSRYQYPSSLPPEVQQRMIEATAKVLLRTGYDQAPFNIEFYWDEEQDSIHLLEINTRISKSHCSLFKMVDGEYHHQVMIDLALGREPSFPHRQGEFALAAKFMLRRHRDGRVVRVPDRAQIEELKQTFPGSELLLNVCPGIRLSELLDQDSYSYELADLFIGAAGPRQLEQRYQAALSLLPFEIEERGGTA